MLDAGSDPRSTSAPPPRRERRGRLVRALRGCRVRRRHGEGRSTHLPVGQAVPAEGEAPPHGRHGRGRLPPTQGRWRGIADARAVRPRRRRRPTSLHHVAVCSAFSASQRRTLAAELTPFEEGGRRRPPLAAAQWADPTRPTAVSRVPGVPNRWSAGGPRAAWVPLRCERVVEVTCENISGMRFRHPARFVRWRPDKAPGRTARSTSSTSRCPTSSARSSATTADPALRWRSPDACAARRGETWTRGPDAYRSAKSPASRRPVPAHWTRGPSRVPERQVSGRRVARSRRDLDASALTRTSAKSPCAEVDAAAHRHDGTAAISPRRRCLRADTGPAGSFTAFSAMMARCGPTTGVGPLRPAGCRRPRGDTVMGMNASTPARAPITVGDRPRPALPARAGRLGLLVGSCSQRLAGCSESDKASAAPRARTIGHPAAGGPHGAIQPTKPATARR